MKQILGWIGVSLILLAYALNMFQILDVTHVIYGMLNLLGAIGIIISSYAKRDFQPVLLNVIWLVVALFGIIRSFI